jgi:hypothetical protein
MSNFKYFEARTAHLHSLLSRPTNHNIYVYINNILQVISTPISSSEGLKLVLGKVTKLLKLRLNKRSRLKCSRERSCMIKSIKC